jgi:uncharacterized protein (TIGR02646 family)
MKRIGGLDAPTAGLARFLADDSLDKTWNAFGNFETGAARQEFTGALTKIQHGLRAYREIDLRPGDTRVDHFVPQNDPESGAARACDHTNLLAVCWGGSDAAIFGPATRSPDPTRYLPPVAKNLSCDAAKGNSPPVDILDPRLAPELPSITVIMSTGELIADQSACLSQGASEDVVKTHIRRLGLDIGRLRINREAVWGAPRASVDELAGANDPDFATNLARFAARRLLPDENGRMNKYFTTARSFFGPIAEQILDISPRGWI